MAKGYYADRLPHEDQSQMRAAIRSPWKKALARYVNKSFNGGVKLREPVDAMPNPVAL